MRKSKRQNSAHNHPHIDFPPSLCFHHIIRMNRIMIIPATDIRIISAIMIIPSP